MYATAMAGRGARRRGAFDLFDRQPEILHPRCKHIIENPPRLRDIEFGRLLLACHGRWIPPDDACEAY